MKGYLLFFFIFSQLLHAQDVRILDFSYYLDVNHTKKINEILLKKVPLTPMSNKNTTLGFQRSTVWLYIKLKNETEQNISNVIRFTYPLHDYIDVYFFHNSELFQHYQTGDLTKFNTRAIKTNKFVFPYTIEALSTQTIIVKINSQSALNLEMNFLSQNDYFSLLNNESLLYGIFYGAVVIMLLYNLILFFIIKDKVYLYYVIFHFVNLFLQLGLNGLAFEYFYPNYPQLNLTFIPITFALANYFVIKFALLFLEFDKLQLKLKRYFQILSALSLLTVVMSFIISYSSVIIFITLLSMLTVISLFLIGIYILRHYKTNASKFFVTAWSFMLIGVFIEEAHNLGLIGSGFISSYGAQIGTLIELSLLAVALAYRYNSLHLALIKTKSNLNILNKGLEKKVLHRTQILDEKNKQLHLEVTNKNILLRELYHRVKNNLQIISSLLSLQLKRIPDQQSRELFQESISRIKAIAMIHEKLYESDNLQIISMQNYTQELVDDLKSSFCDKEIDFQIICEDINLDLEVAVPIGLVTNELVTNALKYAFPNAQKDKKIKIKMQFNEDNTFSLIIADNGKGADIKTLKEGFGFKLLEFLVSYQLKGTIKTEGDNGLIHEITFSKELII